MEKGRPPAKKELRTEYLPDGNGVPLDEIEFNRILHLAGLTWLPRLDSSM
jgi:hypothetical protein